MADAGDKGPRDFAAEQGVAAGFTVEEGVKVMMALARGQQANGGRGFTDAELTQVIEEVRSLRIGGVLANMILHGDLLIQVDDKGVVRFLTSSDFAAEVEAS